MVLIFNGAQVLVAVTRSLHSAAELTKGNLQAHYCPLKMDGVKN